MNEQLWRLAWALPLVIALGLALIYWLKRLGVGQGSAGTANQAVVRSNTALTERTRVLVVEVGHQVFVVFESEATIAVQPQDARVHAVARPSFLTGTAASFPWRQHGPTT